MSRSGQDHGIPGANVPGMRRSGPRRALLLAAVVLAGSALPAHAAPANDHLADAVLVTSLPYRNARSIAGATRQTGERSTSCTTSTATVWYELRLPAETEVVLTTSGSTYNTSVAVFRGSSRTFSALTFVDCVNDLGTQQLAALGFTAAANTRYFIQVGSASGSTGRLELRITTGKQILVPETRVADVTSVHARIVVARDDSETEVIGRERLQGCVVGFCIPLVDVGQQASDEPAPHARGCAMIVIFITQCAGPED